MKHFLAPFFSFKTLIIALLIVFNYQATAQNASYNTNSIPIGGTNSCALGFNALFSNSGINNVGVGHSALYSNFNGKFNTAIGNYALYNNSSFADDNTAIGYRSLYTNGSFGYKNTGLGSGSDVASSSLTNATAIGYNAIVNASNSIQLGNSSVTAVYAGTSTNATFFTGGLQVS